MTRKHSSRTMLLVCAGVASLGLIAGVAPAAAKKKTKVKTKTVTVTQTGAASTCLNSNSPIASNNNQTLNNFPNAGVAGIQVTVPPYRGMPQGGTVTAVNGVGVRITHTFDADLSVVLVAPGSRVDPLSLSQGGTGHGYGTGAKDCSGDLVQFGDAFDTPITTPGNTGTNPIDGAFKPQVPLSSLVGTPADGTWNLVVTDGAAQDDGTLNAFRLSITYTYLAEVRVPTKHKHKKKK